MGEPGNEGGTGATRRGIVRSGGRGFKGRNVFASPAGGGVASKDHHSSPPAPGFPAMSSVYDEFAAVLLAHKVVSPEQLVEAWQLANRTGSSLAEALVLLGYVCAEEVARARAAWA